MALAGSVDAGARLRAHIKAAQGLDARVTYLADFRERGIRGRFAIIPTKGNRNENLLALLSRLHAENVVSFVIDTSEDDELFDLLLEMPQVTVIPVHTKEINISSWWRYGLEGVRATAERLGLIEWDVAILNDDCRPDLGWFDRVAAGMRRDGSFAACSGTSAHKLTVAEPVNLWYRMTGWAFMVAGESNLQPDTRQRWWYSDDAIDWQARQMGGMTMVAGGYVPHFHPNGQMSPELQVIAAEDRERFIKTWGKAPF